MLKIIFQDLLLEQKRNKGQLIVKSIVMVATIGLGFFLPFPYLFLLPLITVASNHSDTTIDGRDKYHLPHIQYILPISRTMLKSYFLLCSGMTAVLYSVVTLLGYCSCYIGTVYLHDGRYGIGVDIEGEGVLHYFLLTLIICLGIFLFALQDKVSQYAKECQVQRDTVTSVFIRMGTLTKGAAFFSRIAIAATMVFCASSMMGIHIIPESMDGVYLVVLFLLALLGWCLYPWVIYRCSKQLLVADYQ